MKYFNQNIVVQITKTTNTWNETFQQTFINNTLATKLECRLTNS